MNFTFLRVIRSVTGCRRESRRVQVNSVEFQKNLPSGCLRTRNLLELFSSHTLGIVSTSFRSPLCHREVAIGTNYWNNKSLPNTSLLHPFICHLPKMTFSHHHRVACRQCKLSSSNYSTTPSP